MRIGGKSFALTDGVFGKSQNWRYTLKPLVVFRGWGIALVRRHDRGSR